MIRLNKENLTRNDGAEVAEGKVRTADQSELHHAVVVHGARDPNLVSNETFE